jgi:hypothetical protein
LTGTVAHHIDEGIGLNRCGELQAEASCSVGFWLEPQAFGAAGEFTHSGSAPSSWSSDIEYRGI